MIYYFSAFLSAFLLFLVQPMTARAILPYFGGIPAVWVTTMMSFQILLLVGYFYSYKIVKLPKLYLLLHAAIISLTLFFLPLNLEINGESALTAAPAFAVLVIILQCVGVLFLALSFNTILLQYWYKINFKKKNPYPLYAASNFGSVLGLLAYPIIFENYFSLSEQQEIFSIGYAAYAVLTLALIAFTWKKFGATKKIVKKTEEKIAIKTKLNWVFWAFIPSSLMLSFTTYFTTDIAAIPLFWIIPLTLYLLTFIFAFSEFSSKTKWFNFSSQIFEFTLILTLVFFSMALLGSNLIDSFITISIVGILFFISTAFICHTKLYFNKPKAESLGSFYILIALGGALGGAFNSIIAPLIFNGIYEFYITALACCLLLSNQKIQNKAILVPPFVTLILFVVLLSFAFFSDGESLAILVKIMSIVLVIVLFKLRKHSLHFMATICFALMLYLAVTPKLYELKERNFFGSVEIRKEDDSMKMIHGNILHGIQYLSPAQKTVPATYYKTPIDHILSAIPTIAKQGDFAVIGLGAGTLACQASKNQKMDFYEIDQKIVDIASNPKYFSYLQDCPGEYKIYVGDARLILKQNIDKKYSLIFFDAYSSDSIPTHLLTQQALDLYIERSAQPAILAFHISNRYINLLPLLTKLAENKNLDILYFAAGEDLISETETPSVWVVMTSNNLKFNKKLEALGWTKPTEKLDRAWTDDYVNILPLLKFFEE